MRSRFLFAALVLVALCASIAVAGVRVFCSPYGCSDQAPVLLARCAHKRVDIASRVSSIDPVADELIPADRRGVKVCVILDRSQAHQAWCAASRLSVSLCSGAVLGNNPRSDEVRRSTSRPTGNQWQRRRAS